MLSGHDPVEAPEHYELEVDVLHEDTGEREKCLLECIDLIKALGFDNSYHLGNALKYLFRCKRKGKYLEDLKKARWYINDLIEEEERKATHADE